MSMIYMVSYPINLYKWSPLSVLLHNFLHCGWSTSSKWMPAVGPKLNGLMVIACTMHTRKPNWIEPIPTASLSARSHPQTRNHRPLSSLHKCGASANTAAASPPLLTPVRSAPSHQPPPSRTPIPFGDLAGVVCSSSPDCLMDYQPTTSYPRDDSSFWNRRQQQAVGSIFLSLF